MNLRLADVSGKRFLEPLCRRVSGLSRAIAGMNFPSNLMTNQCFTGNNGLSQPLDLFLLSSRSLIGPRSWKSQLDHLRSPAGSGSPPGSAYSVYPVWKSFGSSVTKSLSIQRQLDQLDAVRDLHTMHSSHGGVPNTSEEDLADIFDKVVGPFSTEEVWCEIFEHGPVRFTRRVDHRLMTFKSLMVNKSTSVISSALTKGLLSPSIPADSVSNDPVLDCLAACDLLVMDPQTSACRISSPYARKVLATYHSQLSDSTGGIFRQFKRRFLGI